MPITDLSWLVMSAFAAGVLTWAARAHVLSRGMLDVPNARSSHTQPTPRGGGLAIVTTIALGISLLYVFGELSAPQAGALLIGSVTIAAVGYIDDKRGLAARYRLAVHVAAAACAVAMLAGSEGAREIFPALPVLVGFMVLVLGVVWCINLFNFMDGVDGIAASQAVFVAGASALMVLLAADGANVWSAVLALTSGACIGFLVWNWPPAKIFMGDVGSGFLGFWLAAVAILLHLGGALTIWSSLILGMLFVADATVTLVRRVISGERWYDAHRTHAYQCLSRRFGSHRIVTLGTWMVNLLVVLPLALCSQRNPDDAPWMAVTLFVSFGVLCLLCGAGKPER